MLEKLREKSTAFKKIFTILSAHKKICILLACLLAIGAYVYLDKSGVMSARSAKQGAEAVSRAVPVVAVAAKKGTSASISPGSAPSPPSIPSP